MNLKENPERNTSYTRVPQRGENKLNPKTITRPLQLLAEHFRALTPVSTSEWIRMSHNVALCRIRGLN